MQLTKIALEPGSRMLRIGLGQHEHRWFIRIDLWAVGFRVTRRQHV
jgi:hypothetical protein